MNAAIYALYWYRVEWNLENPVMFRRRLIWAGPSPDEYAMCSANTRDLGDIYANIASLGCCDERPLNYYPLLDRLISWMDTTY